MKLACITLFLAVGVHFGLCTEFEESKDPENALIGTQNYAPTKKESKFVKKVPKALMEFGGLVDKDMLKKKKGDYITWFAIVREITRDRKSGGLQFIGESKYFVGIGDIHMQTVSINGAGDFVVACDSAAYDLAPAMLARIYGHVKEIDAEGRPVVAAEYIRIWPWSFFNFNDAGDDASLPKRREGLHLDKIRIYSMHPEMPDYYKERLALSPSELESQHQWWVRNEKRINSK